MDLHYNNPYPSTEHGRTEQIVSQFLLKTLHIVLESRVPSIWPSPSGRTSLGAQPQVKKSDKWFHLALGDRPGALDSLNFWHRNLMEPMIIDIILVQEMPGPGFGGALLETVIERWVVQYEHSKTSHQGGESYYKKTYKKAIVLLRSLYTMMRLLPAYRAYRKLSTNPNPNSKGKACDFVINYKVSSFSAPFTRSEEQVMKHYSFFPVEAQHGRLFISVKYRESLSDFNLETSASFPPEIITDYVGSPATDPFRAFPTSYFPVSEMPPPQQQQQRPHSWAGSGGGGPFQSPPAHRSSSGRYDLSSPPTITSSAVYGNRTHSYRPHSFDDSPPFSPSPPTYTYLSGGGNNSQLTAPVCIPNPLITRTPRYLSPNLSDPNRHSLPPLSPRSTRHELSSQESPSAIRYLKKSEMSRVGDLSSGSGNHHSSGHKVSRDYKYDSGRSSGLLSSSGSPRIGFSRSSSRLSLQDELDDIDFSCPFIVDDVDTCDSPVSGSGKKSSQDAAVGALVRMLRTAAPLRQEDSSSSCCYSSSSGNDHHHNDHLETQFNNNNTRGMSMTAAATMTTSSSFASRKTSTDALEELKAYTLIKHLILSKTPT